MPPMNPGMGMDMIRFIKKPRKGLLFGEIES